MVVQDPMQISCFSYILRVCIFPKKIVTSTRVLPIERMTYRDMFHKNLQVSHNQILRYFLSTSLGFNHVRQLQVLQVKAWNQKSSTSGLSGKSLESKITFSLVIVGMVNQSFFIFIFSVYDAYC